MVHLRQSWPEGMAFQKLRSTAPCKAILKRYKRLLKKRGKCFIRTGTHGCKDKRAVRHAGFIDHGHNTSYCAKCAVVLRGSLCGHFVPQTGGEPPSNQNATQGIYGNIREVRVSGHGPTRQALLSS